jgi:hypothetical protein
MSKKPTKKQLIALLKKISYKFNEHQTKDDRILRGYTLCANIEGLTELNNEILQLTHKY